MNKQPCLADIDGFRKMPYDPPYSIEEIREVYGRVVANRLLKDPVHRWRAETGIELLHPEPTFDEQARTLANWKSMSEKQKKISDKKSIEMFGKPNLDRAEELFERWPKNKNPAGLPKQANTPPPIDEIIESAKTHYPASGSHGWNHIQSVLSTAETLLGRKLRPNEVAAIVYHDSSLSSGPRETHADDSAGIAEKELKGYFRRRQLNNILAAIAHHRASYEGERKSRLENLVASADREFPDPKKKLLRSYAYHIESGESHEDAIRSAVKHLAEKYGTGGYAWSNAPKMYMDANKDRISEIQAGFDNLDEETAKKWMY